MSAERGHFALILALVVALAPAGRAARGCGGAGRMKAP